MTSGTDVEFIEGENHNRVATLRVRGRLDANTAPLLLSRCAEIQARGQNLVLNLAEVSFLGSSGVGALLALVEQFQEQAGAVCFVCLSQEAEMVIELLDLGAYLSIYRSEEEALETLAA